MSEILNVHLATCMHIILKSRDVQLEFRLISSTSSRINQLSKLIRIDCLFTLSFASTSVIGMYNMSLDMYVCMYITI